MKRITHKTLISALQDSDSFMLAILDLDFNYEFVNQGYANIFNFKVDYFIGKNHFELFPNKLLEKLFLDVIQKKQHVNHEAISDSEVKNSKSKIHWNWNIKPVIDGGNCIGISITITDVSREYEAIKHGDFVDSRYEEQFNRNLSGLYWRDLKGNILRCNNAFANILGASKAEDLQNKNIYDFLDVTKKEKIAELNEIVDGKINQRGKQIKLKDGASKWIIESGVFFESESEGKIFEGNIIDITDLKIANERIENQRLELFKAQAKYYSAQMNPHFIFNAINSLNSLIIDENWEESLIFTTDLANLIRRLLENSVRDSISVADEINFLNSYLALEQKRLRTNFKFSVNAKSNSALTTTQIPVLIIQPFVENAVKHAMSAVINGEITVDFDIHKNAVTCRVQDNGPGIESRIKEKQDQESLGIKITESRLALFNIENSKTEFGVEIDSRRLKGVRVDITLPIIK